MYDFDAELDRRPFDSVKWSYLESEYPGRPDLIPLWVADMDFASPPEVTRALRERAEHPVYGYAGKPPAYYGAFRAWMSARHGADPSEEWISFSPGIVPAIAAAVRAFTREGDGVAIMPPVYHPFRQLIEGNRRLPVEAPLLRRDGRWEMDFDAIDRACAEADALILCSPHNPVGRVWTAAEMDSLAEITARRGTIVVADEIHADLVYAPNRHLPSFEPPGRFGGRLVSCWAPSKTFNMPGLQVSYIVVPDPDLRARFRAEMDAAGLGTPNCMGVPAAVAAYAHGGPWLDAALAYLRGNYERLASELGRLLPGVAVAPCEGTYLAWLDLRGLGLSGDVRRTLVEKAGLWLDPGTRFGAGGSGFARLNFACTRATLDRAIDRLAAAFA